MASHEPANGNGEHQPTEFELRRAELVEEIGVSLESVLTQINALNRNLEAIIEIGNEFASVEALWSQFETVMDRAQGDGANGEGEGVEQKKVQEQESAERAS